MSSYIPPATVEKLSQDIPKGMRHKAKIDLAMSLIGNGLPDSAVIATLREKFTEASDREIEDVVVWVRKMNPAPTQTQAVVRYTPRPARQEPATPKRSPIEHAEWWSNGGRLEPDVMIAQSPVSFGTNPKDYAVMLLSSLYRSTDHLNIVCRYIMDKEKARPVGAGKILAAAHWINYIDANGVPSSNAGAWFRLNPCGSQGSGFEGAVTDADMATFKYVLVESDILPLAIQLFLYRRWKLPVAAVVLSGGQSAHAWVRVEADNLESYKSISTRLLKMLEPFGVDPANSNPSRLCRFPGAWRKIGAVDGGEQRLLWLNPNVSPLNEESLKQFEASLALPIILDEPLKPVAMAAINRYEWLRNNRDKLGVPTGIPEFDKLTGGLKKGQTTVVAGPTGGGKSTLALHMVKAALDSGHGVALFSLEMDREEVFDLLVAAYSSVNRNHFNNGEFSDTEITLMTTHMSRIKKLPLYIEDSAMTSADQIKARVLQLKADGRIGLVVVDYIQFVNPGLSKDNREQQVAGISHALRTVARETQLPMIVLSQLNDEGNIRESRVIAHNANIVMMVEAGETDFKVRVVKGRGIPTGEYAMVFERAYARLKPANKIDNADVPRRDQYQ